jgi:PAS domain S-box-containing protein
MSQATPDPDGAPRSAAESERDILLERYRVMTEESSDMIILYENDELVSVSDAFERILGRRAAEDMRYGRYLEIIHPDDRDEALKLNGRPRPGELRKATYRVMHADGHYIWVEVMNRGTVDPVTGVFHEIGVARDITERKEHELALEAAQRRAEAANRAKTVFLANMSHELRTPLNAILGFSEIMRRELMGPVGCENYREYMKMIHESGQLLLSVIANILDMAKIETGRLTLDPMHTEVAPMVSECVRTFAADAARAGVTIGTRLGVDAVHADARALKQMLGNLLSNAVKFTPRGGNVLVEAEQADGCAAFRIHDTGIGIAPEALERLGRPFEYGRPEAMLAKAAPGAGLGLALVRALAEAHGGAFAIDSQLGIGTTVTIRLPQQQQPPAQSVA